MKRAGGSISTASEAKKRRGTHDTFMKWQREYDRELYTLSWLDCQSEFEHGKKVVTKLSCSVCSKYQDKIKGRKMIKKRKAINGSLALNRYVRRT